MRLKVLDENDLPYEILLTTRQKIKLRNLFNNNMSTDLTLSKAQLSKSNPAWRVFRIIIK